MPGGSTWVACTRARRVRLNGRDLGTLIGPEFPVVLEKGSIKAANLLEVCRDKPVGEPHRAISIGRGATWKKFYNVNMPARLPENRGADGLFTAAKWEPLESGLVGPVTLSRLAISREGGHSSIQIGAVANHTTVAMSIHSFV